MNRRALLAGLAALPFVPKIAQAAPATAPAILGMSDVTWSQSFEVLRGPPAQIFVYDERSGKVLAFWDVDQDVADGDTVTFEWPPQVSAV